MNRVREGEDAMKGIRVRDRQDESELVMNRDRDHGSATESRSGQEESTVFHATGICADASSRTDTCDREIFET